MSARPPDLAFWTGTRPRVVGVFLSIVPFLYSKDQARGGAAAARSPRSRYRRSNVFSFVAVLSGPAVELPQTMYWSQTESSPQVFHLRPRHDLWGVGHCALRHDPRVRGTLYYGYNARSKSVVLGSRMARPSPTRVVFVLGFVSLINSLTSRGKTVPHTPHFHVMCTDDGDPSGDLCARFTIVNILQ